MNIEKTFEVACVFVTTRSGIEPLFLKIYENGNKVETTSDHYTLAQYLSSLYLFGKHISNSGLLDEELEVEHLGYKSKSSRKNMDFFFSINDVITTIIGVKFQKRSQEIETAVRNKVILITKEFETMFEDDLRRKSKLLSRYLEKFENRCDSIVKE